LCSGFLRGLTEREIAAAPAVNGEIFRAPSALPGLDDYCMEYICAYREGLFGPKKN